MSVVMQINYAAPKWSPERAREVALRLAALPVMNWELLIQCETDGTWGGVYLFETEASAYAWERQARSLLAAMGSIRVLTQLLYSDETQSDARFVEPPAAAA
jgi:Putative mono-oxygenase ydhR